MKVTLDVSFDDESKSHSLFIIKSQIISTFSGLLIQVIPDFPRSSFLCRHLEARPANGGYLVVFFDVSGHRSLVVHASVETLR